MIVEDFLDLLLRDFPGPTMCWTFLSGSSSSSQRIRSINIAANRFPAASYPPNSRVVYDTTLLGEFKSPFVGTGAAGIITFQQFNNVSLMAA